MPTTQPTDPQLEEIRKLKKIVEEMNTEIQKEIHKPFYRKALSEFFSGIFRGVGLIIGTTIVAALVFYALQTLIDWTQLQSDITNWAEQTAQDSVENAMPDNISSLFH